MVPTVRIVPSAGNDTNPKRSLAANPSKSLPLRSHPPPVSMSTRTWPAQRPPSSVPKAQSLDLHYSKKGQQKSSNDHPESHHKCRCRLEPLVQLALAKTTYKGGGLGVGAGLGAGVEPGVGARVGNGVGARVGLGGGDRVGNGVRAGVEPGVGAELVMGSVRASDSQLLLLSDDGRRPTVFQRGFIPRGSFLETTFRSSVGWTPPEGIHSRSLVIGDCCDELLRSSLHIGLHHID